MKTQERETPTKIASILDLEFFQVLKTTTGLILGPLFDKVRWDIGLNL